MFAFNRLSKNYSENESVRDLNLSFCPFDDGLYVLDNLTGIIDRHTLHRMISHVLGPPF